MLMTLHPGDLILDHCRRWWQGRGSKGWAQVSANQVEERRWPSIRQHPGCSGARAALLERSMLAHHLKQPLSLWLHPASPTHLRARTGWQQRSSAIVAAAGCCGRRRLTGCCWRRRLALPLGLLTPLQLVAQQPLLI